MIQRRDNKTYFSYEGYESRFGQNRRPALVRCSIETRDEYQFGIHTYLKRTLYIDGVVEVTREEISEDGKCPSEYLMMVEPMPQADPDQKEKGPNMIATRFDPGSQEDWFTLMWDTKEFNRMGDPMAFSLFAIALNRYVVDVSLLSNVLYRFQQEDQQALLGILEYIAWSLSQKKIALIKGLLRSFGKESPLVFPPDLKAAGRDLESDSEDLSVHKYTDALIRSHSETKNTNKGFLSLLEWLRNDKATIGMETIDRYHPYLDEDGRNNVLKRYFYAVKQGEMKYDQSLNRLFASRNYQYYPLLRYVYGSYPEKRRVEAEFLIDCLTTYEKTNQQQFQVSDGVLDWVVRKSIEKNRPIDLNFSKWLSVCEGGVIVNPEFAGFADFKIQYELEEEFEESSVEASVKDLMARSCIQKSHIEKEPIIDPQTEKPAIDLKTGEPLMREIVVKEPVWEYYPNDKQYVDLFVNWEAKKAPLAEHTFTEDMICYSQVEEKVRQYCNERYEGEEIWLSSGKKDRIVEMFGAPIKMKASLREAVQLGTNPGVDLSLVKERIRNRLKELFGETLECEYDLTKLFTAQIDSLHNPQSNKEEVFVTKHQYYRRGYRYCAPKLAEKQNLLTGRRCAICQSDMCFVTSLKKEPEWKDYKLLHVLHIIGYPVFEETDAGIIPTDVYNIFVAQVNKALAFYRLLTCKECGHILFPSNPSKKTHYYKCTQSWCGQYNKDVYLNWCHECKKIIDSRDTKQCPNGWYICPKCGACCSDTFLEGLVIRRQHQGLPIPASLSAAVGRGHAERKMYFCYKCGAQKVWIQDKDGKSEWRCPNCDPHQEDNDPPPPTFEYEYPF